MFFKWISDNWDYEHNEAVSVYGGNFTPEVEADLHAFVVPAGCHWKDVFETTKQTGAKNDQVLVQPQLANPNLLNNVFGDVNWSVRFDHESVSGDLLDSAYEYLLREFAEASGKKAGEFLTPRYVVHQIVTLLEPKSCDSIADPACGPGICPMTGTVTPASEVVVLGLAHSTATSS